jgi:hypothetical protein
MPGPGSILGDFQLEERIGRGGMGEVYRATQLSLGRTVAVKLIAPEHAEDPGFRERFKREAHLAAGLDHPHVIPVHQADEAGGVLYLAMRHVGGTDLGRLIATENRLEPARAVALMGQVAAALDAAHARGLVHRDVKPSNVLVTGLEGEEHAYLTDFGITRSTAADATRTQTDGLAGTLDYAAPEQLRGQTVGPAADVYALGCVLYELLTGQRPFERETAAAKVYAHLFEPPPRPSAAVPGLPPSLDVVVELAMAKDPDARYSSAGALARAARTAAVTAPGGTAHAAGTAVGSGATATAAARGAVAHAPASATARQAPARRRLAPALVVGAASVAAVAVIAVTSFGGDDASALEHQRAVGAICDEANRVQSERRRRFASYRRRLSRERRLTGRVDLMVHETERRLASTADLASRVDALAGLPPELAAVQETTRRAWSRTVGRLQAHRDGLRRVRSYAGLERRLASLPRSAFERDAGVVASGLRRMGGSACDLDPLAAEPVIRIATRSNRTVALSPPPDSEPSDPAVPRITLVPATAAHRRTGRDRDEPIETPSSTPDPSPDPQSHR